jgi:hypothetical protein
MGSKGGQNNPNPIVELVTAQVPRDSIGLCELNKVRGDPREG